MASRKVPNSVKFTIHIGANVNSRGPLAAWPRRWAAAAAPALAAVLALAAAGPAMAGTQAAALRDTSHPAPAPHAGATRDVLRLHPMPEGTVRFGRQHGRLTVRAALFGLTPGSAHGVDLRLPGGLVRFSPLTANAVGRAPALYSHTLSM
jgi:hypothetical protein